MLAKICTTCGIEKPVSAFHRNRTQADGLHNQCKECKGDSSRRSYQKNREKVLVKQAKYAANNRHVNRSASLRRKYGISLEQYEAMYRAQGGRCALCGAKRPLYGTPKNRALNVDHDHKTGKIRQLLCRLCNVGLGAFKDNPDLLRAAIRYLNQQNSR